jgi:hypothetical protein
MNELFLLLFYSLILFPFYSTLLLQTELRPVTPIFMVMTRISGHMLEAQGHMHEWGFEWAG